MDRTQRIWFDISIPFADIWRTVIRNKLQCSSWKIFCLPLSLFCATSIETYKANIRQKRVLCLVLEFISFHWIFNLLNFLASTTTRKLQPKSNNHTGLFAFQCQQLDAKFGWTIAKQCTIWKQYKSYPTTVTVQWPWTKITGTIIGAAKSVEQENFIVFFLFLKLYFFHYME